MNKIFYNGKILPSEEIKINMNDRGYQFGDGVYEVVRFYNKKPFRLEEHLLRYRSSAEKIDIPFEYSISYLEEQIMKLINESNYSSGYVYTQLTRGVSERNHLFKEEELNSQLLIYIKQEEERPLKTMSEGCKVLITEDIRWLKCDVKSLNLLGSVLTKNEAAKRNAKEAVLIREGYVTEGSASNVFIVVSGVLYTHPANNLILDGITRRTVIDIAKNIGIEIRETPFILELFKNADEAFLTSSISEITPIVKYEEKLNDEYKEGIIGKGYRGKITEKIQKKYGELI